MPDISFPEVHLRDKLPEGLRDMTMDDVQKAVDDVQKAIPEVKFPKLDLGRDARNAGKAAEKAASKASKSVEKAASQAAKQAERMTRDVRKSAGREVDKVAKAAENALPRRPGPNPVPIAILAMAGGAVVGWILATNPSTGPRIRSWFDDLRMRFDDWKRSRDMGSDFSDDPDYLGPIGTDGNPVAFTEAGRAPISPDRFSGTLSESETGMGTEAGQLPQGMGTTEPTATERPH